MARQGYKRTRVNGKERDSVNEAREKSIDKGRSEIERQISRIRGN